MSTAVRSPVALLVAAFAAAICAVVNDPAFLSAIVVLWFLAVVPGTVLCAFLGLGGPGAFQWAVILATSFALDALVSELLLYAHIWTPERALLLLVVLSVAVIAAVPRVRMVTRG